MFFAALRRQGPVPNPAAAKRQRGQALPLFVLSLVVIIGAVAIVTDISWFWVSQQRMQRAADAAALAGAIYLPGDTATAYSTALAEATKNGYTTGVSGVTVSPIQDSSNRRRLDVTITGPVNWTFARVFNAAQPGQWNSANVTVRSKAEYVLPVPMGSPQNYFGVGDFLKTTITSNNVDADTGYNNATSEPSSTNWSNATYAYTWNNGSHATTSTASAQLQLSLFGLAAEIPAGAIIDGLSVQVGGNVSAASASCKFGVDLSWDNGTTWSTQISSANLSTTNTVLAALGSTSATTAWGAHAWVIGDFADANFRSRVTYQKGTSCGTAGLDGIEVRVDYHTVNVTSSTATKTIQAPDGTTLASQGFWGAIITEGGSRENGDEFSPANDNLHGTANAEYDGTGYDYVVQTSGANGKVEIFDPEFCETGPNGASGLMGAGDHWISGSPNAVTTVYSLWNENGTPYSTNDDTLITTSGNTFANEIQADYSGTMGTPANSGLTNCANDTYHNAWWTLASNLAAGRYRMNVTTSVAGNTSTNAENMWSGWVTSSGATPQIYGEARMVAYNNLVSGTQLFYLAQIDKTAAGKTMEISLFDPGDVSGNASLRIKSPDGNAYNYANFTWTADNGLSSGGSSVSTITTATAGGSLFNDSVITIDVTLPSTYGSVGLTPAGESQAGWWKIEYNVSGGNDTTTWQVAIRGNPVHLVQ